MVNTFPIKNDNFNYFTSKKFLLQFTFKMIKYICILCKKNTLKIHSIEKNYNTKTYLIKFAHISKRQTFVMKAAKIFNDTNLLKQFSSADAMEIGIFKALSDFE